LDQPYEDVGYIIFYKLGIAVTGFHDNDESQKAITIFEEGYWDDSKETAIMYKE
jgi:hypothetical protein